MYIIIIIIIINFRSPALSVFARLTFQLKEYVPFIYCMPNCGSCRGRKGLTLQKHLFIVCVYTYVLFYVCAEKSLEVCICFMTEFDCPEVTLCGLVDRTLKSNY